MLCIFVSLALIFNLVPYIWATNSTENTASKREHKVHNIVLYPDKHSWCKATPIVQVVGHPGCSTVKTDNNVCVGACFSYVVPRTVPETPGDVSPYCDSCQPGHISWKKVILECTEGTFKNQNLTKYVEYIHDCNCGSCKDGGKLTKGEDVETEDTSSDDCSSLLNDCSLNATSEVNQISANSSQTDEFKTIISGILKTLNNEDENILENAESKGLHRNVWKNLLEKVETANNSLDTGNFNELVKSVEGELKVKFNYKRLKQALMKLKKYDVSKMSNLFNKSLDSTDSSKGNELLTSNFSKISPRSSSNEIIQQEASSHGTNNIASDVPKSVTGGSEIINHDNVQKSLTSNAENQTSVGRS